MNRQFDLVIRRATVVTSADMVACDVGIKDGRIAALGLALDRGQREIDASAMLLLPGGVDIHCHVDQRSSSGLTTADDFHSASVSAACGGTTTLVPFAAQHRGMSASAVVREYHARAGGRALVDYGFHLIVSDPRPEVLAEELPALAAGGIASLKVYMTYDALALDDGQMLQVLDLAARLGLPVMVHAENRAVVAWQTDRLLRAGLTAPKHHPRARPALAEREATHRAIALAELTGASLLVVHVSTADALDEIRRARDRGVDVHAETCPQYLRFTAADLDLPGFEGARLIFSPPPREAADQQALWRGLADGSIEVFSSDHAPYRYDDPQGKKVHGEQASFDWVPNGVPGLETRMPLLFSEGVLQGRIDLHRFVELTATAPARLCGLYPRKGTIAVGGDADLAIWDPRREVVIRHEKLHDRMDYTPYEGMTVRGWPVVTVARGEVVWSGGQTHGEPGRGRFVPRDRSSDPRPG